MSITTAYTKNLTDPLQDWSSLADVAASDEVPIRGRDILTA
jgi:hypothetical protein